ncbi:hypothetical protein PspMM1_38560 [Pseudoalteromonas sp. MM1]|nr:hypothetical protein PspMM1_38560 [Pseudoalteromonas sp. MM1]
MEAQQHRVVIIIGKVFYCVGWRFAYQAHTGTYLTAQVNTPPKIINSLYRPTFNGKVIYIFERVDSINPFT